jgi:SOS-response transcriptional repressor LexA
MSFKERLTAWNGGIFRGAARRLAKRLRVSEPLVSGWVNNKPPSEAQAVRIAQEFGITAAQVLAMFAERKSAAPSGVDMQTLRYGSMGTPVLGSVAADRFSIAFDAPPEDHIPNPDPSKGLFALRISGDCMEPVLREGEYVYIDPAAEPRDKSVVLAFLDGEYTLKRYRVFPDGAYLVPENAKYPRRKITNNKTMVRGVAVGKYQRGL